MINATELRIGNLILDGGGNIVKVTPQRLADIDNNLVVSNPIPLTEEILLKIEGMSLFEYEGMKTYTLNESLNDSMDGIGFSDGDLMIYEQNGVFACNGINFKYLHDLQNFAFYELGKKELQINL